MKNTPFEIKAYNLSQLAELYEISVRTMHQWLEPHKEAIGPKKGQLYTPLQVSIIFDKLGIPPKLSAKYGDE